MFDLMEGVGRRGGGGDRKSARRKVIKRMYGKKTQNICFCRRITKKKTVWIKTIFAPFVDVC